MIGCILLTAFLFGTGYSSLNMLSSLPIDALKLDMRFVRNICENEKDLRMVKLVLDIAKYLEVMTTAEGVEKKEQYFLCGVAFEIAHSLKGVYGNLSLTPLYEPMCELTELLKRQDRVRLQCFI